MEMKRRNSLKLLQRYWMIFAMALVIGVLMTSSVLGADKSENKATATGFDDAQYLTNGSKVSATVCGRGVVSAFPPAVYYRFKLSSKQSVVIDITSTDYRASLHMYNSKREEIDTPQKFWHISGGRAGSYTYSKTLSAGTYYAAVVADSVFPARYDLSFKTSGNTATPTPTVVPTPTKLEVPRGLKVDLKNCKAVTLTWKKVNNVSGYHIYVATIPA